MEESGKKWIDKKITRREFPKKSRNDWSRGRLLGASGSLGDFSQTKPKIIELLLTEMKKLVSTVNTKLEITTLMQKCAYFVVLDLHSTKRDDVIKMFKEWTKYSEKLMNGELVEPALKNHYYPPKDTGETVGLNPYRLTLTFGD